VRTGSKKQSRGFEKLVFGPEKEHFKLGTKEDMVPEEIITI
jgi:hypothetical protein